MKLVYLLTILLLTFTACSNKKELEITKSTQITNQNNEDSDDDFLDEFEEAERDQIEVYDPLEPYNRAMTTFNDKVFTYVLNPVSKGYAFVMPTPARKGVSNFFHNLFYPVRLINNLLQGKFENSLEETGRFLMNSTFGILGLFDPASDLFDMKKHNEDFGQTLGYWGVGAGPHIVIPFIGPANLRDLVGRTSDSYINPSIYTEGNNYALANDSKQSLALFTFYNTNRNSLNIGLYESIKKDSIDFYTFSRDFYEEKRQKDIKE